MDPISEPAAGIAFGRFQVLPHRRELLADGQPLNLGGRAYDVLMTLIEARGTVVSKDTLMARVWPDRVVEENALQVQISALRAAFGPDRELIRTVSGRGYQFTGEIRVFGRQPEERAGARPWSPPNLPSAAHRTNIPEPVSELIGRDDELREVLRSCRRTSTGDPYRRGRDRQDAIGAGGRAHAAAELRRRCLGRGTGAADRPRTRPGRHRGGTRARTLRRHRLARKCGHCAECERRSCWCWTIASMSSTRRLQWPRRCCERLRPRA